jgi:hypothetical protein
MRRREMQMELDIGEEHRRLRELVGRNVGLQREVDRLEQMMGVGTVMMMDGGNENDTMLLS